MAINFPTSLDNFTNPSSGNTLDSPSHSLQHSDINDAVEALERKVGLGTAVAGSASAGQVLTASTGGTTTWSTPTTPGLVQIVPTSVAVGSGSGSVDANGAVTFSGASSVSLNSCFSATYDNYLVLVSYTGTGTAVDLNIRLRLSGTDATGAGTYKSQYIDASSTSVSGARDSNTYHLIGTSSSTASMLQSSKVHLYDVFKASPTAIQAENQSNLSSGYLRIVGGSHTVSTAYDGFTVYPGSGNLTGLIRVYGYKN